MSKTNNVIENNKPSNTEKDKNNILSQKNEQTADQLSDRKSSFVFGTLGEGRAYQPK